MRHDAYDAARLSAIWDAMQTGASVDGGDDQLRAAIARLEEIGHTPPPSPDLARQTWEQLTGGPLPLMPLVAMPASSTNGRHMPAATAAVPMMRTVSRRQEKVSIVITAIAIGSMGGFAAGFVAGLWMRVAMRISGALTTDANRGLLTENEAAVGQITLSGTMSIAMFGGMVGILGGLLYLLLRRWIPGNPWQRPLVYGGLLLAVLGFVVMDQSNPDYRLFGPPVVNVGTCAFAYIVFGVLAVVLIDWLDRRVPRFGTSGGSRRRTILIGVALAPFALAGSLAIAGVVLQPVAMLVAAGPIGALVPVIGGLGILLYKRVRRVRTLPLISALVRRPALIGYAAFAAPSLIGLVLTVRAITAIVGG
jgi:hypothetical protein